MIRILDKFGEILMKRVRDKAVEDWQAIISGHMKGKSAERVRVRLSSFTPEEIAAFLSMLPEVVDTTLHHLLWTLDQEASLELTVRNEKGEPVSIRELSDGLPGELYGERGWIARFSTKPLPPR